LCAAQKRAAREPGAPKKGCGGGREGVSRAAGQSAFHKP
jgi:hypothetical protein